MLGEGQFESLLPVPVAEGHTHAQRQEQVQTRRTHKHKDFSNGKPVRAEGPAHARRGGAVPRVPRCPGCPRPGCADRDPPGELEGAWGAAWGKGQGSQQWGGREGEGGPAAPVLVLKWPQARQGTDGLFLRLSWRKWGKGKEKINTTTVRNLKINPNT